MGNLLAAATVSELMTQITGLMTSVLGVIEGNDILLLLFASPIVYIAIRGVKKLAH